MCALAHVLEQEGLSTVAIVTKARTFPERMRPPRVLFCDFPLGRPLGKPNDPAFQHDVLRSAFALLQEPEGPVLVDYPVAIADSGDEPLACSLPPAMDPDVPASVSEARGLREAVLRGSGGGLVDPLDAEGVEAALWAFERAAHGTPWREAGFPLSPHKSSLAVRSYYERAAIGLFQEAPRARSAETWFVHHTCAGAVIRTARDQMRAAGEPDTVWNMLLSAAQRGPT